MTEHHYYRQIAHLVLSCFSLAFSSVFFLKVGVVNSVIYFFLFTVVIRLQLILVVWSCSKILNDLYARALVLASCRLGIGLSYELQ